ncbi:glycosyltransferase family 2 protein [Pontibacter populi]|uniref:Glycosyltransferase family A protein n=1 Tax=Pontibacter populi TaxID=890055 RepID=A0ABV1RV91_9BACT
MSTKLVSVVIPNFNNAIWLPACIESCLQQKSILEIIVVDDHSTDESWQVLASYKKMYPSLIKIYQNPDKGANYARNYGFEQTYGEFIQWLDSDDVLLNDKFSNQIAQLEAQGADIAYSDFRIDEYKKGGLINQTIKAYGPFEDFTEELLKDNWTCPNNYLVRRNIAVKLANGIGWNNNTKIGQDREYFTVAALLGAKFIYVEGCFAVYNRWSEGTISGMSFKRRLELNQIIEKRFKSMILESNFPEYKKKNYLRILNTHKLKACFYNPSIKVDDLFFLSEIRWDLIHYKMKVILPFVYFNQTLIFIFNKIRLCFR